MAHPAVAVVESALRARKLDRTLTSALPSLDRTDPLACAGSGIAALDASLHGGLPRGHLSELAGARSSGRTSLLLQFIAAATRRGEIAALVDTFDCFDVPTAVAAGVDLDRLLWVRGQAIGRPRDPVPGEPHGPAFRLRTSRIGPDGDAWGVRAGPVVDGTVDRALKALNLVLQAGGFGVVALDLADVAPSTLAQIPFITWMRVQRTVEGSDTACVLAVPAPLARSAGGVTLSLTARSTWAGSADRSRRLAGHAITMTVISPRRRVDGEVRLEAVASGGC